MAAHAGSRRGRDQQRLTLTNVQCGDAGGYDVIVTNAPARHQQVAPGTVVSPPVLVAQPTNQTVAAGQTAAFSFSVTNDCGGAPTYQWQYAGTNLAGATATTLTSPTLKPQMQAPTRSA